MGNFFSHENNNNNNLQDLQNRLERIEKLDLNNDGVISKDEFEKWKNNDLVTLKDAIKDEVRQEYEEKLNDLNSTINDLNKQLTSVKNVNKELEDTMKDKNALIERMGANINTDDDVKELVKMLSKEQINRYVEELLEDEGTNIKYLPDFVERQIYRNIFKLIIKLMNKILGSMSFELVGHKLHMNMVPKGKETFERSINPIVLDDDESIDQLADQYDYTHPENL